MRIAIVRLGAGPLLAPQNSEMFGGAEVRAWTFSRGLAQQTDHEISLVMRKIEAELPAVIEGVRLFCLADNSRVIRREMPWGDRVRRWLSKTGHSVKRRFQDKPTPWQEGMSLAADVFVAVGVQDPAASIVRLAQLRGRKSVVLLTSDEDAWRILGPHQRLTASQRRYRFALLECDLVVTQTQLQHDLVEQAGQRSVLIRNPIDLTMDASRVRPLQQRSHVLWVGRADGDSKRADLLAELATNCPEVPFTAIMNPVSNRGGERSLQIAFPDNVRLVRHVAFSEVESYFSDAIGLVNTSESEGFPNTFLQAGKYGVPVLSRRVNPDDVLTKHGIGFVAGDSMERLAEMVRNLYQRPESFRYVSQAGRQYVKKYHQASDRVFELAAAIDSLFGQKLRKAA